MSLISAVADRSRAAARPEHRDAGFTLIEVLVAMVIFALVSTGILYGMVTVLQITRDSRATQVATNLASEAIDTARATTNLFALTDITTPTPIVINGDNFYVKRTARWVSDPTADITCGSSGGNLRYKRVDIEVTWDNMRSDEGAVEVYTVINPSERINDPAKGTIVVSVLDSNGIGNSGVQVRAVPASPANGAVALAANPSDTDTNGCSYVLKVVPGNYNVTITKTNNLDNNQVASATKLVGVGAGAAATVGFTYDLAATYNVKYGVNTSGIRIPNNMQTSFISTYGTAVSSATTSATSRSITRHPFVGGYSVIAGNAPTDAETGCAAVDPASWPTEMNGETVVNTRTPNVAAIPGGSVDAPVAMGVVTVTGISDRWVKAVSSAANTPGCAVASTYIFDKSTTASGKLALPFGTWTLTSGTTSGTQNTTIAKSAITPVTHGKFNSGNAITLYPYGETP